MKKIIIFFLFIWSASAWSFSCKTASGALIPESGGSADVYVNLAPTIGKNENLVIDLTNEISCWNKWPKTIIDYVSITKSSTYGGALLNFNGSLKYAGKGYAFPLLGDTHAIEYRNGIENPAPWPVMLYLTPINFNTAGGVVINQGSLIAVLNLRQWNNRGSGSSNYRWNIYTINTTVVPVGGCDVSARNVSVTLPEYPGNTQAIPLSIYCASNQNISYYLTGTTDTSTSIFANTLSGANTATGVGIQLVRNGSAVPANQNVQLGRVGSSSVNLGLSARYARTRGQVTAGKVQSVIGVTFMYD